MYVVTMQTIEAMFSFFFVILIASAILQPVNSQHLDDSVYRLQLAQDAWRVLYLRGDFNDLNDINMAPKVGPKRLTLEADMNQIKDQTSLCVFMYGIWLTNCEGGDQKHEITSSIQIICSTP